MTDSRCVVVIPCFNEVERLKEPDVQALLSVRGMHVVLVDDGSTDGTGELLERLSLDCAGVEHVGLPRNLGKAEAVRHGLLAAVSSGATIVGFTDADFSTPPDEVQRLVRLLEARPDLAGLVGSRVLLAGRTIERSLFRHIVGRVVATYLSATYRLPVYDTQCGAKFFRVTSQLKAALADEFVTRWLFDVELMLRLSAEHQVPVEKLIREEPLERWCHASGSHVVGQESRRLLLDFLALRRMSRQRPLASPR